MNPSNYQFNPLIEDLVQILMTKTQNFNPQFFRLQINFYLNLVPSVLNIHIESPITGKIPINFYGVNLAQSGSGKGYSTNVLEEVLLKDFKNHFMFKVFPDMADLSLEQEALNRVSGTTQSIDMIEEMLRKEFNSYGEYKFSFDSATGPALKQLRNKLLLAKIGALNLIIDEIGYNLQGNTEALVALLELYDKGLIKEKLTKNTADNARFRQLSGGTPTNLLMFGTPSKLLNGSKTEEDYFEFLESGYARRCFFSFSNKASSHLHLTAEQLYDSLSQNNHESVLQQISQRLFSLCDINIVGSTISVSRDVGIRLMEYRQYCENLAENLPDFAEVQKAELTHRYFKTLKLAGAYAFLEGSLSISMDNLENAIRFAEESGEAIAKMYEREKPYEKLAKYVADNQAKELTQVDIANDLPFYKGTRANKIELMHMATAWGYKNNIIIKKSFKDGIEFFTGETLKETDLDQLTVAYSQSFSDGYLNDTAKWAGLSKLVTTQGYNWLNHHSLNGKRSNKDMSTGFNLIVLDIDGGVPISVVESLMGDYKYLIHTTKRHQVPDATGKAYDRFRLIFPTNYELHLSEAEFKEFMQNIANWLPFTGLDVQTFQRSRKWSCYDKATIIDNEGKLFDVLPFIPQTSRAEEYKQAQVDLGNLDNLERWFASHMIKGDRNNTLAKYGFMLMDSGCTLPAIEERLLDFNSKLSNPLDEERIRKTVLTSLRNRSMNTNE